MKTTNTHMQSKSPHELKGYYETLIKNYKKLNKYIENSKTKGVQPNEQDKMHHNLDIIKEKISDFNKLYGAYIRKRRNSFGKFNIESFINDMCGKNKQKRSKLLRLYDNVENNLNLNIKLGLNSDAANLASNELAQSEQIYNPGNYSMDNDNWKNGKRKEMGGKAYNNLFERSEDKSEKYAETANGINPYAGIYPQQMPYNNYYVEDGSQRYVNNDGNYMFNVQDPYNNMHNYPPMEVEIQTNTLGKKSPRLPAKNVGFQNSNDYQYYNPSMFQHNDSASKKGSSDSVTPTKQSKANFSPKEMMSDQRFSMLDNTSIFKLSDDREGHSNETVSKLERILGEVKLSEKTKIYIKEMCDIIIESVCNTSCMIARNSNREFLDEDDIKLAFKMEYNIDFPDAFKKFKSFEVDSEYEKKISLIEKEKKRKTKI